MTKFQKSPKCKKWWNGLSAEGAKANVRSALHSADDPPFFVFLSFSCIFFCCGSIFSMGSMGSSKATGRCYTSICDGIILFFFCKKSQSDCFVVTHLLLPCSSLRTCFLTGAKRFDAKEWVGGFPRGEGGTGEWATGEIGQVPSQIMGATSLSGPEIIRGHKIVCAGN